MALEKASLSNANGGKYLCTESQRLMCRHKYTCLTYLIDFLEHTRTKRFYESRERFAVFEYMCGIRGCAPFGETKRFPVEYWVNLSVGPIAEAFDRLSSALDIPDPQLHKQMNVTDLTSWKQMFDAAMADIRRFAYDIIPEKLANSGIYNRTTFEERFGMQWQNE